MPDRPQDERRVAADDDASCPLNSPGEDTEACPLVAPRDEHAGGAMETPEGAGKHGALGEARTGRIAAVIYTGISLLAAAIFVLVTTYVGTYPVVARYGGAAWVFVLLMIVLMPFVIPRVRKWRS